MTAVILRRVFWGDYGSLLMHGEAFVRAETDVDLDLPTGTIVYSAVLPSPPIVFPVGFFICQSQIRSLLVAEFPFLKFAPVFVDRAVTVPWRKWIQKGKCRIPRSGEPEDYFVDFDEPEGFEAGLSVNYWSLEVDEFVYLNGPVESGIIPTTNAKIPDSPFVWGETKPGVRGGRALFCNDKVLDLLWDYREVLDMFVIN